MSSLTVKDRLKELLPEIFTEKKTEGDYYLRLEISEEIIVLISLQEVEESLMVASINITPIPNLPSYVLGLMSFRSQVLFTIDLAQLAGLKPLPTNYREYPTVVVRNNLFGDELGLLGLAVRRILGIYKIKSDLFQSGSFDIPTSLIPYIKNSVMEDDKRLFVLDIDKLIWERINSTQSV